jgi:outer membrane protein OmpU
MKHEGKTMKKVLFATTALVATAGVAAADINLTGSANVGLRDTGTGDTFLHQEIDLNFVLSGSTDNGLTFGGSMDFDEGNTAARDPELFISGAWGTLTMGALDAATDALGLADLGFDGIGMDDDVEALRIQGEADVNYSYSVAGFSLLLSYGVGGTTGVDSNEGDYGVVLGYEMGDFSGQVGYSRDDVTGDVGAGLQLAYSANGLTITTLFTERDLRVGTDVSGGGINVAYTMDAFTFGASYADTDAVGDFEDYGVGVTYDLGGGLKLSGAVGSVDNVSVADFGLTMSF